MIVSSMSNTMGWVALAEGMHRAIVCRTVRAYFNIARLLGSCNTASGVRARWVSLRSGSHMMARFAPQSWRRASVFVITPRSKL